WTRGPLLRAGSRVGAAATRRWRRPTAPRPRAESCRSRRIWRPSLANSALRQRASVVLCIACSPVVLRNLVNGYEREVGLLALRHGADLSRQRQRQDDERLLAVGLHDQEVAAVEPRVQLAEAVTAVFDLDDEVAAGEREQQIARKAAAGGTGQRH